MWIEFTKKAKIIFPDRTAFYYRPGERFDLPPEWCAGWLERGEAVEIAEPDTVRVPDPWVPPSLGDDILTVACVRRSGGIYDRHDYVGRLARGVGRNLTVPHRFVCLSDSTDVPDEVQHIPLLHDWRGFWAKVELFRPGLFRGPVLYFDLDTVICGPIDDLAMAPQPLVIAWDMQHGWVNSSLMRWSCDLSHVYEAMVADPGGMVAKYECGTGLWGDQGLLQDQLVARHVPWVWAQHIFPERLRWHPPGNRDRDPPDGTTVAMWYGSPKPHEMTTEFLATHWR